MKRICTVYRGSRTEEMYLYVDQAEDLARVPEALLARFGKLEKALTVALHPARKLARADVNKVLESIEKEGFYLQMPPRPDDYLLDLRGHLVPPETGSDA